MSAEPLDRMTSRPGWDLQPAPRHPNGLQRHLVGENAEVAASPVPLRERSFIPVPLDFNPIPMMQDYLDELRINQRSRDYIRMVRVALIYFSDYLRSEKVLTAEDITRVHIVYFQDHLSQMRQPNGKPYAPSYRSQLVGYIHHWLNWLCETGYLEDSPWKHIRNPRPRKKPKPLENDEVLALFETHRSQTFTLTPFMFHRQEVILTLLFAWGLRIHELHGIDVMHVDARLNFVTVRNKGGGSKQMPYGQAIKGVVQRYLQARTRYGALDEGALLIDQSGKRLSIDMIRQTIENLGARANVAVTPHRLRDTMGTVMLDGDVEVERLMKMMGHSSRNMTLAYARVNDHKVLESHDRVMGPLVESYLSAPAVAQTNAAERATEQETASSINETNAFTGVITDEEREALRRRRAQRRRREAVR